ncbi:MAG TPA: hypothetical protein VJJ81_00405 [Candidatus Babeliales bacterium]|nr:hypothetical protein [Candidatus Babeliales bacterium]
MINEAPKLSTRPLLVFSYAVLLHLIILAIFFIQISDSDFGRKLTEKLTQNKLAQTIIQKFKPQDSKITAPLKPLELQPPKPVTKISKAQLDRVHAELTERHALEAAKKVKTSDDEQLYFISHVVDMSDEPKEQAKNNTENSSKHPSAKQALAQKTPTSTHSQAVTDSHEEAIFTPEQKPAAVPTNPKLAQLDLTKTSAAITKILELASSYLPEIKHSTNQNRPTETKIIDPATPKTLASPTKTPVNPTNSESLTPEPTETVRQYNDRELAQLQKDLEIKTELLAQQAPLNSQKYKIAKTELQKVKFNLDVNNRADQKFNHPDSQRLDHVTIELPEITGANAQTLDPANTKISTHKTSSNSNNASDKFSASTPEANNNINIGDHSNGPGSKPIIRALAPSAYLRFANANGQHIMSQAGRKSGQPTIEDLRKLSYNAMVMRTFGDAFNAFKLIFNMFINEHTTIFVRFIIDPTGKVVHIDTHSDNATPDVLEFIRKAITYANPFPPLPKHLAKDNYIFGPFAITFHPGRVAGQYVWTQSRAAR